MTPSDDLTRLTAELAEAKNMRDVYRAIIEAATLECVDTVSAAKMREKFCERNDRLVKAEAELAEARRECERLKGTLDTFSKLAQLPGDSTEAFATWASEREQQTTWRPNADELGDARFFWSCGWQWSANRMATRVATEAEMHAAWRKRAEEAESSLTRAEAALAAVRGLVTNWRERADEIDAACKDENTMEHLASSLMGGIASGRRQAADDLESTLNPEAKNG